MTNGHQTVPSIFPKRTSWAWYQEIICLQHVLDISCCAFALILGDICAQKDFVLWTSWTNHGNRWVFKRKSQVSRWRFNRLKNNPLGKALSESLHRLEMPKVLRRLDVLWRIWCAWTLAGRLEPIENFTWAPFRFRAGHPHNSACIWQKHSFGWEILHSSFVANKSQQIATESRMRSGGKGVAVIVEVVTTARTWHWRTWQAPGDASIANKGSQTKHFMAAFKFKPQNF